MDQKLPITDHRASVTIRKTGLVALVIATVLLASCPPPDPTPGPTDDLPPGQTDDLPDAPTNLMLSASDGEIRLTWDEVADAASYRIYRDEERIAMDLTETNYTDSGLTNDILHSYTVRTVGTNGLESVNSDEMSTAAGFPPAAPTMLTTSAAGGQIRLTWRGVANAVSYHVNRDDDLIATDVTATNYTDSTAARGELYRYAVRAVDRFSRRGPAVTGATFRLEMLGTPGNFMATGNSPDREVVLTWDRVTNAVSYHLYRRTDTGEFMRIAEAITETTYTDTTPELNTPYRYVVEAVGVNGGLSSRTSLADVQRVLLLPAPGNFRATAITGSVTLTWDPVFPEGRYRIYRNRALLFTTPGLSIRTYVDTDVTDGTEYTYTVRALSETGSESADSLPKTVTPMEANFSSLALAGNASPTGIWSDGTTMWVADTFDNKLYAYRMSDESRDIPKDIDLITQNPSEFGNDAPVDLWGNDDRLWVLDDRGSTTRIFAYNRSTKMSVTAADFATNTLQAAGGEVPRGMWSDNTTMWVLHLVPGKAFAFNLSSRMRDTDEDGDIVLDRDFNLHADNRSPRGLWSDGGTVWVADDDADKIYAYNLASGARVPDQDFDTLSGAGVGNNDPASMWSDGTTMWVLDSADARIYSYNMDDKENID